MRRGTAEQGGGSMVGRALSMLLWLGGGGLLVAIVFVVSFNLSMRVEMRSSEVGVPELVGRTVEEAGPLVGALELVLEVVDQRNDPNVPSGRVLQQTPGAGIKVRRGRKVKLVVSLGDRVLRVPDLVGQAARAVEIALRRDGFTPGVEVRVPAAGKPPGVVLAQVPPAETPALPNSRVHRLVSADPPRAMWVMPDLGGLSRGPAEAWVSRAGFRVTVRSVRVGGRRAETVVGQFPLAGYPIRTGDVVELTVAR